MNDILERTYEQIDFNSLSNLEPKKIVDEKYLVKNKLIINSQRGNLKYIVTYIV
ncbi:hypothetical protein [uncultured Clostridium sp.]|uniref:hypothetical protein n=1 Tax=uncultured Clostridium sp. TaxID=59620 RepID=UPI0025FF1D18|nr:hypothetical protein [uncultured Clostridium sp.]